MTLEETYNIHKKINCVFLWFKSKHLCKKGLHNYRIAPYKKVQEAHLKCYCCGKEIELKENK